jgi:hypothetical protein
VREECGGDPGKLVRGLLAFAEGRGLNGKPVREADRIRAYELILAYGWGKPPVFAVGTSRSLPRSFGSKSGRLEAGGLN